MNAIQAHMLIGSCLAIALLIGIFICCQLQHEREMKNAIPKIPSLAESLLIVRREIIVAKEGNGSGKVTQESYERNKMRPCSKCHMAPRHITKSGKAGSSMCKGCADEYRKKRREDVNG